MFLSAKNERNRAKKTGMETTWELNIQSRKWNEKLREKKMKW